MKKKFFAVLATGLLLFSMFGIAEAISYNPAADFNIDNGNPNGVWSYGWMPTDFPTFNLYQNTYVDPPSPCPSLRGWYTDPSYTPAIALNTHPTDTCLGVLPGHLALHPGPNYEPSVLRWTAPSDGRYDINGQFFSGDVGIMQVGIRQGSTWLWQGIDAGAFNFSTTVTTNESIDFLVYGSYVSGTTPLDLTISSHEEPGCDLTPILDVLKELNSKIDELKTELNDIKSKVDTGAVIKTKDLNKGVYFMGAKKVK